MPRSVPLADLAATAALILALALAYIVYGQVWAPDLSAVYMAASMVASGQEGAVYAAPAQFYGLQTDPRWLAHLAETGSEGQITLAYVYPPLWAWALAPVAGAVEPMTFFRGALAVQLVALGLSVLLCWRLAGRGRIGWPVWVGLSLAIGIATSPLHLALLHHQPQFLVVALMLITVERLVAGHPGRAGAALAVASALKITPALLLLLFVPRGRRRGMATFAVTGGLLAGASVLLAGWDAHLAFLDQVRLAGGHVLTSAASSGVDWIVTVLTTDIAPAFEDGRIQIRTKPAWLDPVLVAALVAAVAGLMALSRGVPEPARTVLRGAGLILATALILPPGWSHYFLPAVLLAPALWAPQMRPSGPLAYLVLMGGWSLWTAGALARQDLTAGLSQPATQAALNVTCGAFVLLAVLVLMAKARL